MRKSWDEYFMEVAFLAAKRSTCLRRKVGAVLVKDKCLVTTAYNGVVRGAIHCDVRGCLRDKLNIPSGQHHELCWGLHAEQNLIINAARLGISIIGAQVYVTLCPCVICMKMLINSGVSAIYYHEQYPDKLSIDIAKEMGVSLVQV